MLEMYRARKKTITKFCAFVISAIVCLACHDGRPMPKFDEANSAYEPPTIIGQITAAEITESSGLAVSACQEGVLWTHNDSGDGPYVYAIDRAGALLGIWKVPDADNEDWEDMALTRNANGKCYLYIGEIGNTDKLERSRHRIYRIEEPLVARDRIPGSKKDAAATSAAEVLDFKYPNGNHDAETLAVHPKTENIYVLTKSRNKPSSVFKIAPAFGSGTLATAEKMGDFTVPVIPNGFLTGGAISPDGTRAVVCDYAAAYEIVLQPGTDFDEIWKQKPLPISIGQRKQGEAVTYSADGKSILGTSERKGSPIFEVKRRQ